MGVEDTVLDEAALVELEALLETARLGSGGRFRALVKSIEKNSHKPGHKKVRDPAAVAAAIERNKYGKKRSAKMAVAHR